MKVVSIYTDRRLLEIPNTGIQNTSQIAAGQASVSVYGISEGGGNTVNCIFIICVICVTFIFGND
jgi:hypothetical protein